jgi:putative transposase
VFVRIQGVQHYLWRGVDQHGVVLDTLFRSAEMPKPPSAASGAG